MRDLNQEVGDNVALLAWQFAMLQELLAASHALPESATILRPEALETQHLTNRAWSHSDGAGFVYGLPFSPDQSVAGRSV